jgi:hypothetical protein
MGLAGHRPGTLHLKQGPRLSNNWGPPHTYNASHGAIGGTPGYNEDNEDPPAGAYNYVEDRRDSIQSDKDIRDGMRRAGLKFVPERAEAWYGFPAVRPPSQYWE